MNRISSRINKIFRAKGTSVDALWLTIVRLITMVLGLICIKIISVYFSLEEYGLYAQAILIISTTCSFSILGMTDAVNYFYNTNLEQTGSKEQYLATIYGLQTAIGIIAGFAILLGGNFLVNYFKNPQLFAAIGWIAFQPLLQNYIPMLQVLYISVGRAKSIAIVNLFLSVIRLIIFITASLYTHSIVTILALTLICDIAQVLYFVIDLHKHSVIIKIQKFSRQLCWPILAYAVPMAAFVIINSLLRDTDKWIIGYFSNSEELAIYTNCSRLLPFDILTASFFTVLVPIATKYIKQNKPKVKQVYGDYLNIGLILTSILVGLAIWLSKDLLLCLYDKKYLPGLGVFIVYLFVDLSRFANVTLLYSSSGNAKKLLLIVFVSFILNLVLAVIFYKIIGLLGPALATLLTTLFSYGMYILGGSKILEFPLLKLLDYKSFGVVVVEVCIIGYIALTIGTQYMYNFNPIERFLILYLPAVGIVGMLNFKKIITLLKSINSIN